MHAGDDESDHDDALLGVSLSSKPSTKHARQHKKKRNLSRQTCQRSSVHVHVCELIKQQKEQDEQDRLNEIKEKEEYRLNEEKNKRLAKER